MTLVPGGVRVRDQAKLRSPATDKLAWQAVFGSSEDREAARWLRGSWAGHRARPASINDLYLARGRGECGGFTVPAINVRMLAVRHGSRHLSRGPSRQGRRHHPGDCPVRDRVHRAAPRGVRSSDDCGCPAGRLCPATFIQGDHCQVNHKKYQADPEGEVGEVKKLIAEEVGAGFYSIDVDTSTLVDLSQPSLPGTAAAQLRTCGGDHDLHPGSTSAWCYRLGWRRDCGGRHEKQYRRGAARVHAGIQPTLASEETAPGSARSRSRLGPHTAVSCFRTGASRT